MADQLIGRRDALKYFGMLASFPKGQEFLRSWIAAPADASNPHAGHGMHQSSSADSTPNSPYAAQFFKPDEMETIVILTDMIIPTDSKPGAKEAKVGDFIDFTVFSAAEFRPSLQKEWTDGLAWLNGESAKRFGRPFREMSPTQRETLLTEMSLPERDPAAQYPGFKFYRLVKGMTVEGFYTSRAGLIGVLEYKGLDYLPEFPGCTHPEHQA